MGGYIFGKILPPLFYYSAYVQCARELMLRTAVHFYSPLTEKVRFKRTNERMSMFPINSETQEKLVGAKNTHRKKRNDKEARTFRQYFATFSKQMKVSLSSSLSAS